MRDVSLSAIRWSVAGRDRSLPHFERKFYHCAMGLLCFSLYAFVLERSEALIALAALGGALVLGDYLRLIVPAVNQLALRLFGKIMRRDELQSISGNSFYILGLLTAVLFFSKPIVLLSILFLAVGDPSAAVVGTLYGKHKLFGRKSVEGATANFVACTTAAFLFSALYLQLPLDRCCLLAVSGGVIATVAELIPCPIDDNFTIPVFSAVMLTLLQWVIPLY